MKLSVGVDRALRQNGIALRKMRLLSQISDTCICIPLCSGNPLVTSWPTVHLSLWRRVRQSMHTCTNEFSVIFDAFLRFQHTCILQLYPYTRGQGRSLIHCFQHNYMVCVTVQLSTNGTIKATPQTAKNEIIELREILGSWTQQLKAALLHRWMSRPGTPNMQCSVWGQCQWMHLSRQTVCSTIIYYSVSLRWV